MNLTIPNKYVSANQARPSTKYFETTYTEKAFFPPEVSKYSSQEIVKQETSPLWNTIIQHKVIPKELATLAEEIELSSYILELQDDQSWTDEGNSVISPELYECAISFLISQNLYIFRQFGQIIEVPEINPCPDGTVDFSWRTKRARLLINIKPTEVGYQASYYGDFYNGISPTKGSVPATKVSAFLAVWMRELAP